MSRIYEICADEAWTHSSNPQNRYWCFFGGVFGLESDLGKIETRLRDKLAQTSYRREVKWANVSAADLPTYINLVDEFFQCLEDYPVVYRQIFLDRSFVYVPESTEENRTDLDVQYRICYQFLKHAFGIKHLPRANNSFDQIYIRLDSHSSQEHTESLKQFSQDLPKNLGRTDLVVDVSL